MDDVLDHTVLLVEDNPDDAGFVQVAVERSGVPANLKIVRDAEEARAYLSGADPFRDRTRFPQPVLILLDLNLPGASGIRFVEWLRQGEERRLIPVIALTGIVDYDVIKSAFSAGVNSYLLKPKEFAELEAALRLALRYWLVLSSRPA